VQAPKVCAVSWQARGESGTAPVARGNVPADGRAGYRFLKRPKRGQCGYSVSGARHRGTATGWPDREERREPAERTVRSGALADALAESGGGKMVWQISSGAYYAEQKSFSLFPAMLFRVMNLSKYSSLVFI